ncbi:hypothetical protein CRG98_037100 [Punica granatum]|uniref:G domain-containing protein n=1 Tax=Punica granatum TaxID=22663 RepID=A0A2I0IET7_PUNGR|nr:hypothetical protein CRG98_037100 [Punica granatum]
MSALHLFSLHGSSSAFPNLPIASPQCSPSSASLPLLRLVSPPVIFPSLTSSAGKYPNQTCHTVSCADSEAPEIETSAGAEEEEPELEDFYDDGEAPEESDDEGAYSIDFEALEREAKDAAREYSRSLSGELKIEDEAFDKKERGGKRNKRATLKRNTIPDNLLSRVAIVGRPNVGKSALFNRLVGGNKAIVVDEPGVTRDRLYGRSFWGEHEFMAVDTGGVLTISTSQDDLMEDLAITTTIGMDGIPLATREAAVARMPSMIERQAAMAVEESFVIIFLVDGQLIEIDPNLSSVLRKD